MQEIKSFYRHEYLIIKAGAKTTMSLFRDGESVREIEVTLTQDMVVCTDQGNVSVSVSDEDYAEILMHELKGNDD